MSAGQKFRQALKEESPLQIIGTMNAYVAIMAKYAGYRAIYLSGANVANSIYGIPDIGKTTLENVLQEAIKITSAVDTPLLVDIDTGFENIHKTIKEMIKASVAGIHIEDQLLKDKKCGHLSKKNLLSKEKMCDHIKACVDARTDESFVIIARSDAYEMEGLQGVIERLNAYSRAGADMIFPEAIPNLQEYTEIKKNVNVPLLANLTEFGRTPLFSLPELKGAGVDMALYPLSVNRVMNLSALKALEEIRMSGTQLRILDQMQTREELYHFLNYEP